MLLPLCCFMASHPPRGNLIRSFLCWRPATIYAPDFPGFGQSDAPRTAAYAYTFDHLAKTIGDLLGAINVKNYSLYVHDYGAPVGFRIILAHPEVCRR